MSPRPRGQRGTIQQLGTTWRIGYWEPEGPDGKRIRRWKGGFASRREAEKALRKALTDIDQGAYTPPSDTTVSEFLRAWLESIEPHVAPNSWVTYRNHVHYYLAPDEQACAEYLERTGKERPTLGPERLQALTEQRISRHWSQLRERGKRDGSGLAQRTIKGIRITLNAALNSPEARKLLSQPLRLRRIQVPRRPPTVYTPAETTAFLAVAARDRLAAMWLLFATTAMRPSEVLGLRWAAIDLDAEELSIYEKAIKVGSRAVLADGTKTDGSAATIALAPTTVAALRAWRKRQDEERRLWPGPIEEHDLVFTWENGTPLKPDWVNRQFKRLAAEAGLRSGVRLYDLRHGWATAALRAGLHPKLVQEVMRHASYSTTADTYSHVMPSQSAEAVAAVAALFEIPGDDDTDTTTADPKPDPEQPSTDL